MLFFSCSGEMEQMLYYAICEMKKNYEMNRLVRQTKEHKDFWVKRLKRFTVKDVGVLF